MLSRLRKRLGWWSVLAEITVAVSVLHLLGLLGIALLGEGTPRRLDERFIAVAWVAIAVIATVVSWSQRLKRRDAMWYAPGWRNFAPRWLRFADAVADVLWAATFFTTLLIATAGHVSASTAAVLFALSFLPVSVVAQLGTRYEDPPAPRHP
ncbi:hypothetical protein Cme02nite_00010 [Catellatospora methionotrophica]|uniref:Uncharacterized protein n=1 Tax=Catellatospora methionotrophica TaxID=121620 RepID=A0A8J3L552_9ACTN|nr:hypothetical protein [Catellatospora methionotrophica]GIG11669.1 hypothetical protein Cme02nite_00010 [Catellatospora methionotrophica]